MSRRWPGPPSGRAVPILAAVTVGLVLVRAAAFTLSERISFNSDQAIVGLMAKHLSELQSFPFFFYGQNYMLGVQAWLIAPFFAIARPTVTVMRIPLVILNVVAALVLLRALRSQLQLGPSVAFVAALPFVVPTPLVAGSFLEALGTSGVEPLLYMLLLWPLRSRPMGFGALLAFGFLHREFTLYAVPALVAIQAADRSLWTLETGRWWLRAAAGAALTWIALDYVRLHLEGASLFQQAQSAGHFACFELTSLGPRFLFALNTLLVVFSGGSRMALYESGLRSSAVVGSRIVGWIVVGTLAVMLLRISWRWTRRPLQGDPRFGVYLALIGLCALSAYTLSCGRLGTGNILRYANLAVLLPIGLFGVFMVVERSSWLRSLVIAVFSVWGMTSLVDNVRVIHAAYFNPQPNPHREVTDFLVDNQIRYARADYWDAYVIAFLSRERVIVDAFTTVRIPAYGRLVDENQDAAVHIVRMPCEGWKQIAAWCIQLPAREPAQGPP